MRDTAESTELTITIYGSCVSRDIAEYLKPLNVGLSGYTARQSLISACGAKELHWPALVADRLRSRFQRNAVESDLKGDLALRLSATRSETSLVISDLVDERNGVFIFPSGAVVTNSLELNESGLLGELGEHAKLIKFGTDRHFELWNSALVNLSTLVAAWGNVTIVFLRHEWATESTEGVQFPFGESKLDPRRMNGLLRRYFDAVTEVGFETVNVPSELCLTTTDHPWGIAPFHYAPLFHSYVAKRIAKLARDKR